MSITPFQIPHPLQTFIYWYKILTTIKVLITIEIKDYLFFSFRFPLAFFPSWTSSPNKRPERRFITPRLNRNTKFTSLSQRFSLCMYLHWLHTWIVQYLLIRIITTDNLSGPSWIFIDLQWWMGVWLIYHDLVIFIKTTKNNKQNTKFKDH